MDLIIIYMIMMEMLSYEGKFKHSFYIIILYMESARYSPILITLKKEPFKIVNNIVIDT